MSGVHIRRTVGALIGVLACLVVDDAFATDLLELYARAREFDPTFQAARYEREIGDLVIRESRAGVLPIISANAQDSKTYQDIKSSDNFLFTEGKSDFYNAAYSLSITQPIYRSDALNRIPQAQAEARQAEAQYAAAEQDLMSRVAQAAFNYMAARDNLDYAVAERAAIWQQLQESEARLGSGLATITDVHDARARFALAEASEIDANDALEETRQAIAEITGELPLDLETLSELFPLATPDRTDVQAWVETARFQNLTIKARREGVTIAEREISLQRASRLPTLDFVATLNRSDSGGTVFGGGNDIRTTDLALRLGIPLYDGGRASALTRSAGLRHNIAMQELEREKRRAEREVRASFQGVMSGILRVEALGKSVFSNEAALSEKQQGLRSGVNTGKDVLDARRDLFLAKRDLAQARYIYVLNSVRLKQSAGVLSLEDLRKINDYLQ